MVNGMTDHKALVERLRKGPGPSGIDPLGLRRDARAAIEQLVRERDEALEVLRKIREFYRHGEDPRDQPQAYLWADTVLAKQEPKP